MSLSNFTGLQTCDIKQMPCRTCLFASKGHIGLSHCEKFPDMKPEDVYFENAPCPEYQQGEDLLTYEPKE